MCFLNGRKRMDEVKRSLRTLRRMDSHSNRSVPNEFGLLGPGSGAGLLAYFGVVEASAAVITGSTRSAINKMAEAEFVLKSAHPVVADIDFSSEVILARGDKDSGRVFTGRVASVEASGENLRVVCSGSPQLQEPMAKAVVAKAPAVDSISRSAERGGLHGVADRT